jgi:hypothetical protein
MIVGKMDGNTVYLLTPQDKQTNNMANAIKVNPDDYKNIIKYIVGDFVADVTTAPDLTEDEKADVESESKAFKEDMSSAEIEAAAEKFGELTEDEASKNALSKLKSCKIS